MKEALKLALALGITCFVAASVLAFAEKKTQGPRDRAAAEKRQAALRLVLPTFANNPVADRVVVGKVTFYPARDAQGHLLALAGEGYTLKGFGGKLTALVSFTPEGKILVVLITHHNETPGLGTQVVDRRRSRSIWRVFGHSHSPKHHGLPPNRYLDSYNGRQASDVGSPEFTVVKKAAEVTKHSVLAVTGATISSRAVQDAVTRICAAFVKGLRERAWTVSS